jgi:hypothetical protein
MRGPSLDPWTWTAERERAAEFAAAFSSAMLSRPYSRSLSFKLPLDRVHRRPRANALRVDEREFEDFEARADAASCNIKP